MALAQTTYLPLHSEQEYLVDRMETINGAWLPNSNSSLKPLSRKTTTTYFNQLQKDALVGLNKSLSKMDLYNLSRAISISGEWTTLADGNDGAIDSKKPILKYFYQKQADLIHVNTDDFFLAINPVLYLQANKERHNSGMRYINTRGLELRGRIKNRIGFYTMLADNQEKAVSYINDWSTQHQAFPGVDYYRSVTPGHYDIFLARGYVDVVALKEKLNITFGYDKQFKGDGMRSLFLSDFGAAATFLRLRSQWKRFSYESLFMELTPDYARVGDRRLPRKYASMHQLIYNVSPRFNIGLFESTLYGKVDNFNLKYVVPIIGYNTLLRALDSRQKTSWGLHFKAIPAIGVQVYGQGYFDKISMAANATPADNQWGAQLGLKYFNAFTLSNLDLQLEANVVRPFTYTSSDGVENYTHYNQPLAHPYGAGFAEIIGSLKYQPLRKLYMHAKGIYSIRGKDSNSLVNYGNDIFKFQDMGMLDANHSWTAGQQLKGIYLNLNMAYEWRPNIFLEVGGTHLRRTVDGVQLPSSTYVYGGIRWNFIRKEYDMY
jgi:hypothetical protein